uniref:Fibrinogen C-terminal domain-containing protein n=2 Tax=Macrostomum lignano TaxID=282301 RepID=A0A1I8J7M0_9PLAT
TTQPRSIAPAVDKQKLQAIDELPRLVNRIVRHFKGVLMGSRRCEIGRFTSIQAALRALCRSTTSSRFVLDCNAQLNGLALGNQVELRWIPGHAAFLGNERADLLAKAGSADALLGPGPGAPIPASVINSRGQVPEERCPLCRSGSENAEHFICHCPVFTRARLTHLGPNPVLSDVCRPESIPLLARYLRDTGRADFFPTAGRRCRRDRRVPLSDIASMVVFGRQGLVEWAVSSASSLHPPDAPCSYVKVGGDNRREVGLKDQQMKSTPLENLSDYETVKSHWFRMRSTALSLPASDSAVQLVAFNASSGLCAHFRCRLGLSHSRKCRNASKRAQPVWTAGSDCWTTVRRRVPGSVDFYRDWTQYQSEFGEGPDGNYWIGLNSLHALTASGPRKLRILMKAWNDSEHWAEYSSFSVGPESDNYRLSVSGFSGSGGIGDCLAFLQQRNAVHHEGRRSRHLH